MSSTMKKRVRVYAFTAGMIVALMAGVPPLDTVDWPKGVVAVLGLVVGILNIRGKEQMDRFLISAIGLKVATRAFLFFNGVPDIYKPVAINFEVFITAALLYVSLVGIYTVVQERTNTYKVWFYLAALALVVVIGLVWNTDNQSVVDYASVGLLILGLVAGYSEGPKNPEQMEAGRGYPYMVSAIAFHLSVEAVASFPLSESFWDLVSLVLEKFAVFTTTGMLVITFMTIFWVLDDITD